MKSLFPAILFASFFGLFTFGIVSLSKNYTKDPNLIRLPYSNGSITKIKYDGHTYIGWGCNFGCGLVHDPDCKCLLLKDQKRKDP